LRCVRDHDFTALSQLCRDDFGIVDVDPAGWREARWHGSVMSSVIPGTLLENLAA